MKKAQLLIPSIIFIVVLCLTACKKDKDLYISGSIVGFVRLLSSDYESGVAIISLEDTDFKTTSNDKGRFQINGIPAGTYNILFEKEGFQSKKINGYQLVGGNVPAMIEVRLYQNYD